MTSRIDRRVFLMSSLGMALLPSTAFAKTQFRRTPQVTQEPQVAKETKEPPKLEITKVITKGIDNSFAAYYKVGTNTEADFHIVRRKESVNQKVTTVYYKAEDKKAGKLFSKPANSTDPVAIVDAKGAGLNGIYKIYDENDEYKAYFMLAPTLNIPSHTEVSSNFLLNVDQALKDLPEGVISALSSSQREVMIARNVNDLYYWLYPSWKTQDEAIPVDPNKPWIEKKNGEWVDNRKTSNTAGFYTEGRILMPQRYIKYGTESEEVDQGDSKDWLKNMTFHEVGHGIDFLKSNLYSDAQGFISAYEEDKTKITGEDELYVAYFLKNRREPFAEITGALMGGLLSKSAARILNNFPTAAEYIRKNVLPKYDYNISVEEVRKKIYPGYLKPKVDNAKLDLSYNYKTMPIEEMALCC